MSEVRAGSSEVRVTATDELRRLLDERGVEHVDAEDGHTQHTWWSDGDHEVAASNSGERLAVYNLTPEQAIDATLGRGTCRIGRGTRGLMHVTTGHCSECGAEVVKPARYCANCGRRVVA